MGEDLTWWPCMEGGQSGCREGNGVSLTTTLMLPPPEFLWPFPPYSTPPPISREGRPHSFLGKLRPRGGIQGQNRSGQVGSEGPSLQGLWERQEPEKRASLSSGGSVRLLRVPPLAPWLFTSQRRTGKGRPEESADGVLSYCRRDSGDSLSWSSWTWVFSLSPRAGVQGTVLSVPACSGPSLQPALRLSVAVGSSRGSHSPSEVESRSLVTIRPGGEVAGIQHELGTDCSGSCYLTPGSERPVPRWALSGRLHQVC